MFKLSLTTKNTFAGIVFCITFYFNKLLLKNMFFNFTNNIKYKSEFNKKKRVNRLKLTRLSDTSVKI